MAATYGMRMLYGGAVSVELPVDLIDSSEIRQIPDHQEVFLSPTTLTSIVFEINDYVQPPPSHQPSPSSSNSQLPSPGTGTETKTTTTVNADGTTTTTTSTSTQVTTISSSRGSASSSQSQLSPHNSSASGTQQPSPADQAALDAHAAKLHFKDVISPPDSLAGSLPIAQPVQLISPSLFSAPAYMLAGNILTIDPPAQTSSRHSSSSSTSTQSTQLESLTHQIQLLVRLPQKRTDLVVRVAVPLKEFARAGRNTGGPGGQGKGSVTEEMIKEELDRAREVVARVVGSLGVREWGVFGN